MKPQAFVNARLLDPASGLDATGALVVVDGKIAAAGCFLPLTKNPNIDKGMGTRHRAAIGVTEDTDALAVVISEETGIISVVHNGRMIRRLDADRLKHVLDAFYRPRGIPEHFGAGLEASAVFATAKANRSSSARAGPFVPSTTTR